MCDGPPAVRRPDVGLSLQPVHTSVKGLARPRFLPEPAPALPACPRAPRRSAGAAGGQWSCSPRPPPGGLVSRRQNQEQSGHGTRETGPALQARGLITQHAHQKCACAAPGVCRVQEGVPKTTTKGSVGGTRNGPWTFPGSCAGCRGKHVCQGNRNSAECPSVWENSGFRQGPAPGHHTRRSVSTSRGSAGSALLRLVLPFFVSLVHPNC